MQDSQWVRKDGLQNHFSYLFMYICRFMQAEFKVIVLISKGLQILELREKVCCGFCGIRKIRKSK